MVVKNDILYLSITYDLVKRYGFSQGNTDNKCSEYRAGIIDSYENIKGIDFINDSKRTVTLVNYDSIPEATRQSKGMPSKAELLKQIQNEQLASLVAFSNEAYNYYLAHPATAKRAKEKAEQASWLLAIAGAKSTHWKPLGFIKAEDFYRKAIDLMNEQATTREWHAWKCTTLKGLIKKLTPFKKALKVSSLSGGEGQGEALNKAFASLISKKTGNSNAEVLGHEQKALLVQMYADGNAKPNFEQVWHIYTRKAQEMISLEHWSDAESIVSPSTVRAFLSKPAIKPLWFEARHGYQEYRNVYEPVTKRERPSYANALWVIDGTPSHRYFQHGDKGRYFRFNIFPILDAHSWCVVGFWLSETENTEAVLGALRSACMVTGHMPHQILYDNSSAIQSYRAQEAIDKISVVSFAATAGNARTKIIEPFFHLLNSDVQKFRPGYTHNPFAISLNNRANREALAKMVKSHELAAAENALKQAIEDLTIYNNLPRKFLAGQSPIQAYRTSVQQTLNKQRPFSELIDINAFWTMPGENKKIRTYDNGKPKTVNTFIPQTYEFTNKGIEITIGGRVRNYDIERADFRSTFIGQRVSVKFEPNPERWINDQPEKLLLYVQGQPVQWQGMHMAALPKEVYHMAIADYRPGEGTQLRTHLTEKKKQRSLVQQQFEELVATTRRNGTHTNMITANAFDKEVIQAAQADINNQIIQGEDYRLAESNNNSLSSGEGRGETDRYSAYDEPLPLD